MACVNKAGQGPYSNLSEKVTLDAAGTFYSALLYFTILKCIFCVHLFRSKTVSIANDDLRYSIRIAPTNDDYKN